MTSSPVESIHEHFAIVNDPRQLGKVDHPLINIIFITITAVLCGADSWVAVEEFGNAQIEWLSQYLDLANGIPSHDTLGKTFAVLDPDQFREGFLNWMQAVCEVIAGVIAIDGKKLRRSHDKRLGQEAIHMVSAWGEANGVVLGNRRSMRNRMKLQLFPSCWRLWT